MKYLKIYEGSNKLKFQEGEDPRYRTYFFSTEKYDYRVTVYPNSDGDPPSFGFKSKKVGWHDFDYDQSIVTNDNMYLIMRTVLEVLEYDMKKYNETAYTISSYSTRKGLQRMNFYKRGLSRNGWVVNPTEYPTYFSISKK
jgi:hypothetical protein